MWAKLQLIDAQNVPQASHRRYRKRRLYGLSKFPESLLRYLEFDGSFSGNETS